MKLSKLKSAGMRTSVAGILTVGAFEVEYETWGKRLVWKPGSEKRKTCLKTFILVQNSLGSFISCSSNPTRTSSYEQYALWKSAGRLGT